jgi:hypothetical protein
MNITNTKALANVHILFSEPSELEIFAKDTER